MKFSTTFCIALSLLSGLVAGMPNPDNAEDAGIEVRATSKLVVSHMLTLYSITRISIREVMAVVAVDMEEAMVVEVMVMEVMVVDVAVMAVIAVAVVMDADVTERFYRYSTSIITPLDGIDTVGARILNSHPC